MVSSSHHSSEDISSDQSESVMMKPIEDEYDEESEKQSLSEIDELQINLNSIKDIDKDDDELLSPVSTSIASERTCSKRKYIETPMNTKKNRKISETTGRKKWNQKKRMCNRRCASIFF